MSRDYADRLNRVVDYIDDHLGSDLTLERLAGVACFSKFHFGRVFQACMGESLFEFIGRTRLERAAARLLHNRSESITSIALACGFDNPSAFSRSFRRHFGVSATAWRAGACTSIPERDSGARSSGIVDPLRNGERVPWPGTS